MYQGGRERNRCIVNKDGNVGLNVERFSNSAYNKLVHIGIARGCRNAEASHLGVGHDA